MGHLYHGKLLNNQRVSRIFPWKTVTSSRAQRAVSPSAFGHHQQLPKRRHSIAGDQATRAGHVLDLCGNHVPPKKNWDGSGRHPPVIKHGWLLNDGFMVNGEWTMMINEG